MSNINARKQTISDKLQGNVATYLRCGEIVNTHIETGLLLSLPMKKNKIGEYLGKLQASRWFFVHFVRPYHTTKDKEFTVHLEFGEKQLLLAVITRILTLPR